MQQLIHSFVIALVFFFIFSPMTYFGLQFRIDIYHERKQTQQLVKALDNALKMKKKMQ